MTALWIHVISCRIISLSVSTENIHWKLVNICGMARFDVSTVRRGTNKVISVESIAIVKRKNKTNRVMGSTVAGKLLLKIILKLNSLKKHYCKYLWKALPEIY